MRYYISTDTEQLFLFFACGRRGHSAKMAEFVKKATEFADELKKLWNIYISVAEEKPFRIILNGISTMMRDNSKRTYLDAFNRTSEAACIDVTNGETIIEGTGKLISNTAIKADHLVVKDCDLEISGLYDGIRANSLEVQFYTIQQKRGLFKGGTT